MTKILRFRKKIGSKSRNDYNTSIVYPETSYTLNTQNLISINSTSFDMYHQLGNDEAYYTMSFTTASHIDQYILESKDSVTFINAFTQDMLTVSPYVTSLAGLTSQASQGSLTDESKEVSLYKITEKQMLEFTQPFPMSFNVVTETDQVVDTFKGSQFLSGTTVTEAMQTVNNESMNDILVFEEAGFDTQDSMSPEAYTSTSISDQTITTSSNQTLILSGPNGSKKFWYTNGQIKFSAAVCTFVLHS